MTTILNLNHLLNNWFVYQICQELPDINTNLINNMLTKAYKQGLGDMVLLNLIDKFNNNSTKDDVLDIIAHTLGENICPVCKEYSVLTTEGMCNECAYSIFI